MIALVGALVVALVGMAAWWFAPYGETAQEGEQVPLGLSVFSDLEGHPRLDREVEVRLPHGSLAVSVAEPLDSLPHGLPLADQGKVDDGDVHAPRGKDFLVLEWEAQASRLAAVLERVPGAELPDEEAVLVSLRLGDRTIELDTDAEDEFDRGWDGHGGAVAVVVDEDDVEDAALEVTFDGLTQVVSLADGSVDAGAASPLYAWGSEPRTYTRPGCVADATLPRDFETDDLVCQADAVASPWLPDQGWAEGGEVWTLVDVRTVVVDSILREGDDEATWSVTLVDHREDVDGVAPLTPLRVVSPEDSETFGTEGVGALVFPTSAEPRTLTMTQEFVLTRDLGTGGRSFAMRVDFTLDLAPYLPATEQS